MNKRTKNVFSYISKMLDRFMQQKIILVLVVKFSFLLVQLSGLLKTLMS